MSLAGSWLLVPKAEYLPAGNSNFVIGVLLPPPGYNVPELRKIAEGFEQGLRATVRWYLENEPWWRAVQSGEYLSFYDRWYREQGRG